jgi:hypothetical protein
MNRPFPIEVAFGVGEGLATSGIPSRLQRSYRITGTGHASFEMESPWHLGSGRVSVAIDPRDFPSPGPHRLVLQVKIRTGPDLSSNWELALPHMPFSFEFDSRLELDSLLTHLDEGARERMQGSVQLLNPYVDPDHSKDPPNLIALPGDLVLRDPPELSIQADRPFDLAHRVEVEFEGVTGRFAVGEIAQPGGEGRRMPFGKVLGLPEGAIKRPGEIRIRAILTADPEIGWAHPAIRSIWPGTIETNWIPAQILRK